jgi:putative DNA primase/helicase
MGKTNREDVMEKGVISQSSGVQIKFNDTLLEPLGICRYISELINTTEPTPHSHILYKLMGEIEKVDFRELAEIGENDNLLNNHYLIITVEQVLKLAQLNKWDLCKNHSFIYLFNGAYWTLFDDEEIKAFLGKAAEKLGVDKFKARYFQFREQLFKQFIATAYLPKPEQSKEEVLINLKNGTFEVGPYGTRIREFDRADFITHMLTFEYNPEAKAPIFESYINKVLPDKNCQKVLFEYLGYVFIQPSTLKLEKTLLLYGPGANGKSVFNDIVNALFGEKNVSSYSLQSLTNENGYFRAMLANKLLNYASEINGSLQTSIFKQLVSGEPVEARLPYKEPFTLTQYAKLIFNCNILPHDVEHTSAYYRRFLIVPFNVTIPEGEQDKELAQKIIKNELSGVFNFILDGLKRLLLQKQFSDCESVNLARLEYEKQSDSVRLFIDDSGYLASPTEYKLIKELYRDYRLFCMDDGYKPVNKSNFIRRLGAFSITIEKKNIGNVAFISKMREVF